MIGRWYNVHVRQMGNGGKHRLSDRQTEADKQRHRQTGRQTGRQWTGRKTDRLHTFVCDATALFGKLSDGGVSEHARHQSWPESIGNEWNNVGVTQRRQQFLVAGREGGRMDTHEHTKP